MSGKASILSRQETPEPGTGATQPQGGGVDGDPQDRTDLTWLELLPCPEPQHLSIVRGEGAERLGQLRVEPALSRGRNESVVWLQLETPQEPQVTGAGPTPVGQGPPRHPIGPGEDLSLGRVVETTPDGEKDVGEDIFGVVGLDAAPYVTLQRLEDLRGDGLEAGASLI